ncbi:MAG: hypothetical protein ACFCBW_06075 [Candidatus Competibacterales bacterium]
MFSTIDAEADFNREVVAPLFWGLPQFPYNLIYGQWGAFKAFLVNHGVPEGAIPHYDPEQAPKTFERLKESDFVIQAIMAYVLREISFYIRQYERIYLEDTEWQAVKCFLALTQRYFDPQWQRDFDIAGASRFDEMANVFEGACGPLLNAACQRLEYFYRTETTREARHRRRVPSTSNQRSPDATSHDVVTEEVILKEEFVERLYKAVTDHPQVKSLIDQVNLKLQQDNRQLRVELAEKHKGLFAVGETEIDLRNILLKIFSAIKPEAELLLTFMISKIQPNRVNIIELNYERGLAEFELALMIEEGGLSEMIHEAITDCNPDTTFPKVVVVCSLLLEELLGKQVNIYFNRRGEVVIEIPEIDERNSKSLAMALRRRIEEAVVQEGKRGVETQGEEDDEAQLLVRLGSNVEQEAETLWRVSQVDDIPPDDEDTSPLEDESIEDALKAISQRFSQERQRRVAAGFPALRSAPEGGNPAPGESPSPLEGGARARALASTAVDPNKLADLEARFARTEHPSWSLDGEAVSLESSREGSNDFTGSSIDPHRGIVTTLSAREVTKVLLAGLRHSSASRQPVEGRFFELLEDLATEHCGQSLAQLFPELSPVLRQKPTYNAFKALYDIRRQRRSGGDYNAVDALLDGALVASSALKIAP